MTPPRAKTPTSHRIKRGLERLPQREALALRLRYCERATFREIGQELGLSVERSRQIVSRAELRLAYAIVNSTWDVDRILRQIKEDRAAARERLKERLERDGRKLSEELDIWRTRER